MAFLLDTELLLVDKKKMMKQGVRILNYEFARTSNVHDKIAFEISFNRNRIFFF